MRSALGDPGIRAGLASAVLFGASTPIAKLLLGDVSPWLLAGLLYTGSGLGLSAVRLARRAPRERLRADDRLPLAGAVVAGGVVAPVLLLVGLREVAASAASLLLNAETVLTALLAWTVFREHVDRRIALGMGAIVAGALVLAITPGGTAASPLGVLAILGACLCWALDNNLMRAVAAEDAVRLAAIKGLVAGPVNLMLALVLGATLPAPAPLLAALATGFVSYGVSLALFIVALRHVGTARAGAYFAVAPFCGALLAVALGDPVGWQLVAGGALMAVGVRLHLVERHEHRHVHGTEAHHRWHVHDELHRHQHVPPVPAGTRHRHGDVHAPLTHTHPHHPDAQHRHRHLD